MTSFFKRRLQPRTRTALSASSAQIIPLVGVHVGNRDLVEIGISQAPFEVGREDNARWPHPDYDIL
jgi:hypothetical protein